MSTPFSQSRAWVEIDLPAIDRNVGRIKQALPRHVRYVAVVKADAYGHGMPEVARRLLQAGVTVTHECFRGMIHGFILLSAQLAAAHHAIHRAGQALRAAFSAEPTTAFPAFRGPAATPESRP
jgi:acetyl esterase/lipase